MAGGILDAGESLPNGNRRSLMPRQQEPAITPSAVAMPKVIVRLVSDHNISNSSV
jgi:hypothetical protein